MFECLCKCLKKRPTIKNVYKYQSVYKKQKLKRKQLSIRNSADSNLYGERLTSKITAQVCESVGFQVCEMWGICGFWESLIFCELC